MLRVVHILWLRQLKRYARSRSRIIGSLGQPLLFLLALGFGLGPMYKKAGGGNYLDFLAPGVIAMGALFTAMFSGIEVIWDKQFGFLKETLVAPVTRLSIMAGRTLGGATVATAQGVIVFILCVAFGFRTAGLAGLPLALLFLFLIALLFTALGTALASVLDDMQGFQLIMNFLVMPVFFLSGALFPLNNAPPVLTFIARLDPLSYGVDGLRGALSGAPAFSLGLDLGVLAVLTALCLALGSRLFSRIQI